MLFRSVIVAFSGLALALAVLAEPWAIIGIPCLAFWLGFGRSRDHQGSFRAALLALLVLVVALYPWQRYLVTRFDTLAPSTAMSLTLGSVGVFGALALVAALTILGSRLPASAD